MAKIMPIDTILRAIAMPKIFVSSTLKGEQIYRTVIDGQQLTNAISPSEVPVSVVKPFAGEYENKYVIAEGIESCG